MSAHERASFMVEMSVKKGADLDAIADALMDYLCADEIDGLPETIFSVDDVMARRD